MKTRTLVLLLLLVLGGAPVFAQESVTPPTVHHAGLFSYKTPPGWKVLRFPQIENLIGTDPYQRPVPPYIQVDTVDSDTPLDEFIATSMKQMKVKVPSAQILSEKKFVTDQGIKATKIVVSTHPTKNDLKVVYYLLQGPHKTKFIVYCSSLAKTFNQNEPIFDAALKTFVPES